MTSGGGLFGEPSDTLIATTGAVAFLVLVWRIVTTGSRMIDNAELEYLRNINTTPGPNAGRSIDPTKPGPDAKPFNPDRDGISDTDKSPPIYT